MNSGTQRTKSVYVARTVIKPGLCCEDESHSRFSSLEPIFFDDGDAALLLHCKIQQTTFKRIACLAQRKHFGPTELERVRENREENKLRAIPAIAATVFHWTIRLLLLTERWHWSCCGCRWFPLLMRQEQPHFLILWNGRVESSVPKHNVRG